MILMPSTCWHIDLCHKHSSKHCHASSVMRHPGANVEVIAQRPAAATAPMAVLSLIAGAAVATTGPPAYANADVRVSGNLALVAPPVVGESAGAPGTEGLPARVMVGPVQQT